MININSVHMSPPRHAGARACPRGKATWPQVPRRIHVYEREIYPLFAIFFN